MTPKGELKLRCRIAELEQKNRDLLDAMRSIQIAINVWEKSAALEEQNRAARKKLEELRNGTD